MSVEDFFWIDEDKVCTIPEFFPNNILEVYEDHNDRTTSQWLRKLAKVFFLVP